MASALEIALLGPVEVRSGGRPVLLGAAKLRIVLALLTLRAGEVVSLDALIGGLWPDVPPPTAGKTLQGYISELRRGLEPSVGPDRSVIVTRAPGYVLELPPEAIDLGRFERLWAAGRLSLKDGDPEQAAERLSAALALWRGEPLADIVAEAQVSLEAARLEELRLSCMEDRFDAELACGRHTQTVAALENLVESHPFRERFGGQLMLALYRGGRQAEALAIYRRLRSRLADELGVSPAPALALLERSILNHDPVLAGTPAAAAAKLVPAPGRALLVVSESATDLAPLTALAGLIVGDDTGRDLALVRRVAPAGDYAELLRDVTRELTAHRDRIAADGLNARVAAFVSTRPGQDIAKLAVHQEADLILIDGSADLLGGRFGPSAHLLTHATCDVALYLHREGARAGSGVVVPFGGHEHDWAALELGALIASHSGEELLLAGGTREPGSDASRLLAHASLVVQRACGVVADPVMLTPGADGLLALAATARIVLLGLSARFRIEGIGETRYRIAVEAGCDVVFVRRGVRPGVLAPATSTTRFGWSLPRTPARTR